MGYASQDNNTVMITQSAAVANHGIALNDDELAFLFPISDENWLSSRVLHSLRWPVDRDVT
jgi:hypothetical protein